jgi:hypothetical protein
MWATSLIGLLLLDSGEIPENKGTVSRADCDVTCMFLVNEAAL